MISADTRVCVRVCAFFILFSPPPAILCPFPSSLRQEAPFLSRESRDFTVPRSRQLTLSPLNCATNEAAARAREREREGEREKERKSIPMFDCSYLSRCETCSVVLGVTGASAPTSVPWSNGGGQGSGVYFITRHRRRVNGFNDVIPGRSKKTFLWNLH